MNYNNLENFTGEITTNFSRDFKIPLKSESNGTALPSNDAKTTEPIIKILESETYNPMTYYSTEYYTHPPKQNEESSRVKLKTGLKRPISEFGLPSKEGLPAELTKLFLPMSCDLCSIKMNSSLSAKMHYDAKNHDKKVNAWLLEWSKKTGEPVPKREKIQEGSAGPNAYHCNVCDLALTSLQHANQHYMGKKHRMAVTGRTNPHGSGYYGPDGKWIRTNTKSQVDLTGRFNIGESFKQQKSTEIEKPVPEDDIEKYCKICNISVTSVPQMTLHLEGLKHAKKLKSAGAPPHTSKGDTILHSLEKKSKLNPVKRDNSIYRTPSGSYYCKPCNVTIATEALFNQHLDSKKHLKISKQGST